MHILWEETKHSLSITPIDNQHRELFAITNELADIIAAVKGNSESLGCLKRLYAYTQYHFASEENLFLQFNYSDHYKHKSIHREFTSLIKKKFEETKKNPHTDMQPVLSYLTSWIQTHIMDEDKKYADFFKKTGVDISSKYIFGINDNETTSKKNEQALDSLWEKRKLALNIHEIDNQHRELVFILQQANDLNKTGISDARIALFIPLIIKRLFYYSQVHFDLEEQMMKKATFPALKDHKIKHRYFIQQVTDFAQNYKSGKTSLTDEIVHFLKDWTISHILHDDAAFKFHLDSRN